MGSAGSRNVAEGFDHDEAEQQIAGFLGEAAPIAERYGITLVVEPLNRGESNIINSVPEGVRLAKAVNHPSIRALADLYHIVVDDEPLDNILETDGMLAHVHVADTGRFAPGTGEYDMIGFFRRLKAVGYAGRISVECTWKDFDAEGAAAAEYLRTTWEAA
jgi:sugar phosphate isomerase/epimerase